MSHFIRLNTIFVPSPELEQTALKLATKITEGKDILFKIDGKNFLSHLTIYSPEYPAKNLDKVFEAVKKSVMNVPPIELQFESFYQGWGYVGIGFRKTPEIEDLHKEILEALNPLRENHQREKYTKEIAERKYPPEQIKYIKKYGYHNVLTAYEPHLTLARFKDKNVGEQVAKELNTSTNIPSSFVTKLAVSEMGDHGTCTKILKEFEFSRNVAICVFYDQKGNILVQERGSHSKLGEKYGFWGGRIENSETKEEAIKRELVEELNYFPEKIRYWGDDTYTVAVPGRYFGWRIDCRIFIAPITPELEKIKPLEGWGLTKMPIEKAIKHLAARVSSEGKRFFILKTLIAFGEKIESRIKNQKQKAKKIESVEVLFVEAD